VSGLSYSEGELSSTSTTPKGNGLSADQILHHDDAQVNKVRQKSSENAADDDVDIADLDSGRRHSRIRHWDTKFYSIFDKKDHPIPPTTVATSSRLSPVSSRDFQQYGVQPTFQATLAAVGDSPTENENTEELQVHNPSQNQVRAAKPVLNVLTTRTLPGSAGRLCSCRG